MQEQTFAAGECPNCGHDFTAHSAWIANPGDRTCIEQVIASECDVWDELQDVPSYCERFVEADELVAVIVIQCDEIIHTDALPYCDDMACPCHGCTTWAQVEDMIDSLGKPFDAGLLTRQEQDRLWQGRQV